VKEGQFKNHIKPSEKVSADFCILSKVSIDSLFLISSAVLWNTSACFFTSSKESQMVMNEFLGI